MRIKAFLSIRWFWIVKEKSKNYGCIISPCSLSKHLIAHIKDVMEIKVKTAFIHSLHVRKLVTPGKFLLTDLRVDVFQLFIQVRVPDLLTSLKYNELKYRPPTGLRFSSWRVDSKYISNKKIGSVVAEISSSKGKSHNSGSQAQVRPIRQ